LKRTLGKQTNHGQGDPAITASAHQRSMTGNTSVYQNKSTLVSVKVFLKYR